MCNYFSKKYWKYVKMSRDINIEIETLKTFLDLFNQSPGFLFVSEKIFIKKMHYSSVNILFIDITPSKWHVKLYLYIYIFVSSI